MASRQLGHAVPDDMNFNPCIGPPLAEVLALLLRPLGDLRVDEAVVCYRAWSGAVGVNQFITDAGELAARNFPNRGPGRNPLVRSRKLLLPAQPGAEVACRDAEIRSYIRRSEDRAAAVRLDQPVGRVHRPVNATMNRQGLHS